MRILTCYGTRPEKIKLEPVISALRKRGADVETWFSGQSPDLVGEKRPNEVSEMMWSSLPLGMASILAANQNTGLDYDCVIVQGDTATAFACALAAYLADVPVAHVEAGLRTYSRDPWPEEAFRGMITRLAKWHFCPDAYAAGNIHRERGANIQEVEESACIGSVGYDAKNVHVVGNTIIDTLPIVPFCVLVTLHRRENWGERIYEAIGQLWDFSADTGAIITLVRHPNYDSWWNMAAISDRPNKATVIQPVSHDDLLDLMLNSSVVVTDSGGLTEEAAHFGIPCIVVREATERVALLSTGAIRLVNPDEPEELQRALEDELAKRTAYGDGHASEKIAEILMEALE